MENQDLVIVPSKFEKPFPYTFFLCPLCQGEFPVNINYVHLKGCIQEYETHFRIRCEAIPPAINRKEKEIIPTQTSGT